MIFLIANQDRGLISMSLEYILTLCGMFQWAVRQSAEVDSLGRNILRYRKNTFFN